MRIFCLLLGVAFAAAVVIAADKNISDDVIYDQVRVNLAHDRDTGGDNIDVKVTQGVVELSGRVRNDAAKSKAEKIARKVKGVQKVVNQLKVAPAPVS
jgi:osmotically-inducible protein OsmY